MRRGEGGEGGEEGERGGGERGGGGRGGGISFMGLRWCMRPAAAKCCLL